MDQLTLIKKHKNKIINAGIIIVTLCVVFLIYRSQLKNAESLKGRKDMELKKNDAFREIVQLQEKANLYKKSLSRKDTSSVINTITNIAKSSNVRIISVKPAAEEDRPIYVKSPFNLTAGANSYHDLGKFIANIESYPQDLFFIDKALIRPKDAVKEPEEKSKLIINLVISAIGVKN